MVWLKLKWLRMGALCESLAHCVQWGQRVAAIWAANYQLNHWRAAKREDCVGVEGAVTVLEWSQMALLPRIKKIESIRIRLDRHPTGTYCQFYQL
jgi:hypothetical protein